MKMLQRYLDGVIIQGLLTLWKVKRYLNGFLNLFLTTKETVRIIYTKGKTKPVLILLFSITKIVLWAKRSRIQIFIYKRFYTAIKHLIKLSAIFFQLRTAIYSPRFLITER